MMNVENQTVYLIRPKWQGLANDLLVKPEGGEVLFHVKSKHVSVLRRTYFVYDAALQEVLRTEQDHTALFPRHTVFEGNRAIGKLGQAGLIPRNYFVHLDGSPRAEVHIGGRETVFPLRNEKDVIAEIGQHRSTWVVVLSTDQNRFHVLACIAILYREDTLTG